MPTWEVANPFSLTDAVRLLDVLGVEEIPYVSLRLSLPTSDLETVALVEQAAAAEGVVLVRVDP